MAFFQNSVLNKHLNGQDAETVKAAYQKFTAEWMQYFNEQKQKAQALKAEINRVDAEIDKIVYQLYELSEEEISIVENSTK